MGIEKISATECVVIDDSFTGYDSLFAAISLSRDKNKLMLRSQHAQVRRYSARGRASLPKARALNSFSRPGSDNNDMLYKVLPPSQLKLVVRSPWSVRERPFTHHVLRYLAGEGAYQTVNPFRQLMNHVFSLKYPVPGKCQHRLVGKTFYREL